MSKLEILKDTIYKAKELVILRETPKSLSSDYSLWIPFLSAIAGGVLVLVAQSIDRYYKNKTAKKDSLREIYSYCRKLEALMMNNYKELAFYKVRSQYRWYCYRKSIPLNQIYYEEYMKHNLSIREFENKIGETKADFIGHVRKFQAITSLKFEIEQQLSDILNFPNIKAKEFDTGITWDEAYAKIESDDDDLKELYFKNINNFKRINDYLQILSQ